MNFIGLHGHPGVGKSSVALYISDEYDYQEYAFAAPLKQAASRIFGINMDHFSNQDLKNVKDPFWNKTPRELAQLLGTEACRKVFGDDIWIRAFEKKLTAGTVGKRIVFCDVRFPNEMAYILENKGHIIHLTRPGFDGNIGVPGHASEQECISNFMPHYRRSIHHVENDSDLDFLYDQIDSILSEIKNG